MNLEPHHFGTITSLKELARVAGVSTAAASNALSGKGRMSEETRERIIHIAETSSYRPNSYAASLRTGLTKTIGFVMTPDSDPDSEQRWAAYASRLLYELVIEASKHGYTVKIIAANLPHLLAQAHIDFLYYFDPFPDEVLIDEAVRLGIPVLSNDEFNDSRLAFTIDSGFDEMTRAACDLLITKGSSRPGLLAELPDIPSDAIGENTYIQWCNEHNITPRIARGNWGRTDLAERISELLDSGCDSIYSFYEEAEQVLDLLKERGIAVPEDMLLISATSDRKETDALGVTATVYHPELCASEAVPLMIAYSQNKHVGPKIIKIPWELIEGNSTQR